MHRYAFILILLLMLATSRGAAASPWLEADDTYLRQSLLTLANAGLVNVPVNTYPLPWKAIMADLKDVESARLPADLQFAVSHVKHMLNQAQHGGQTAIILSGHSEDLTLAGFGQQHHERGKVTIKHQFTGRTLAARVQINHRHNPSDNRNKTSFDGSYFAASLGDWIVSIDALPLWWGPGQDSALAMSTHARPIEKIQLSRFNPEPLDLPVLNWLGPVSLTSFVGQLDPSRGDANDSLLWGVRVTARPFSAVELGVSHTAQVNGERLDRDAIGANPDLVAIDDNHLLAADIRVSFNTDYGNGAVYGELANDTGDNWVAGSAWLAGLEWHQGDADSHVSWFVEATDTLATCIEGASGGNCFYEHQDYLDGYRHHGQAIGSMYDTDTSAVTFGMRWHNNQGHGWQVKLRDIHFNRDDRQPVAGGHPFFDNATDRQQLELSHRRGIFNGLLEVGIQTWRDRQVGNSEWDSTETGIYGSWEWRF